MTGPFFEPPYPVVRLGPKAEARAIRHGFPWIYAGELVMDRRTSSLLPGALAVLEDPERRPMGVVTVNPQSKIVARVLDADPAAVIDEEWIAARIRAALKHRERLFQHPFYRLVHAEADGLPGVVIDRFGDLAVLQPNTAWAEALHGPITAAIARVTEVRTVVRNGMGRARSLEGLPEEIKVMMGETPKAPIRVPMNAAIYMADVMGGQKTGLFYDQRLNHAFAARLVPPGGHLLDVFCHVGGFGLAALAKQHFTKATCVDSSAAALDMTRRGAEAMRLDAHLTTRQGDAFQVMEAMAADGERFDVVICDPPAFAPNKQALEAGLRAYERVARLAAPLVRDGGYLGLCSCSHAADLAKFRAACARGIGRAGRRGPVIHTGFAGPDHPVLPQLAEGGYLKALFFRL